ncbi:hypothetical protein AHF37_02885 [Paragonimus kellicotti]|nr:hypothetical protein AHF37_02885 [Paragonimus kellicotti]
MYNFCVLICSCIFQVWTTANNYLIKRVVVSLHCLQVDFSGCNRQLRWAYAWAHLLPFRYVFPLQTY